MKIVAGGEETIIIPFIVIPVQIQVALIVILIEDGNARIIILIAPGRALYEISSMTPSLEKISRLNFILNLYVHQYFTPSIFNLQNYLRTRYCKP